MSSRWNRYLDRKRDLGPFTQHEHQLADAIARCTLGWNRESDALGEQLLRDQSRIPDGRSFHKAREGIVAKGLLSYTPPAVRGRGHRGEYELLLGEDRNTRDTAGDSVEPTPSTPLETHAPEREFSAETPVETPAVGRGRIEEGVKKKNDDDGTVDLDGLINGLGPISRSQRTLFADALHANPEGFKTCLDEAQTGKKPPAVLTALIRDGAHLKGRKPKPTKVERWLAAQGAIFDEPTAILVMQDSFGLTEEQAIKLWREHQQERASAVPHDDSTGAPPVGGSSPGASWSDARGRAREGGS